VSWLDSLLRKRSVHVFASDLTIKDVIEIYFKREREKEMALYGGIDCALAERERMLRSYKK
jgi:hypothetical protein